MKCGSPNTPFLLASLYARATNSPLALRLLNYATSCLGRGELQESGPLSESA